MRHRLIEEKELFEALCSADLTDIEDFLGCQITGDLIEDGILDEDSLVEILCQMPDEEFGKFYHDLVMKPRCRKIVLEDNDISFSDVYEEEGFFEFQLKLWFDVDAYFGTNTKDRDDVWINFYVQYHKTNKERVSPILHIDTPDGILVLPWYFDSREEQMILSKLSAYLLKKIGSTVFPED